MPPRGELAPQRDRRKGVAGIAEGGKQQAEAGRAALLAAQTSSASSRMIRERPSASNAIGLITSVPTPASR